MSVIPPLLVREDALAFLENQQILLFEPLTSLVP